MNKDRKRSDAFSRRAELQKLALWLGEWRISRIFQAGDARGVSQPAGPFASETCLGVPRTDTPEHIRHDAGKLRVGQILLLRPGGIGLSKLRLVYVLLLERCDGRSFLVAPFSRFATPAVSGEWQTGLQALPLRVLCLWNARWVSAAILAASWRCGNFKSGLLSRIRAIRRGLEDGKPPAPDELDRLGPPLAHPLDPRHDYLAEERELLDAHLGIDAETGGPGTILRYEDPISPLRKAAEERGKYGDERGGK